jgi:hypothetical protein
MASLFAAPAIVRADSLMKLHHIPERWATVWGVGWDLEVVEVPLWAPMSVAQFGGSACLGGHIEKFREVTDWIYEKPQPPIASVTAHWVNPTLPKEPLDHFPRMQYGEWKMVSVPSLEHPHAVRYEPVTVFDDAKEMDGKHPFIRKLNLKEHCGERHTEHLVELAEANKTRNDDWEIEGKDQHKVDVAHMYELSTGNSNKWDYDRWEAFRNANQPTGPLPKVKFKVAVKSIG